MRGLRGVVIAIAGLTILAGCAASPAVSTGADGEAERAFHDFVVHARADAEAGGAGEEQLAILDEALTSNEITFEQAQEALNNFADCLDGVGLALTGIRVIDDQGFKTFDYRVQSGDEDALMDACEAKTFRWVDMLYQTQPAARRAQDAKFEAALPGLIACLKEAGVPVDDGSPADEVKQAMLAFMADHAPKPGDPGLTMNDDGSWSYDGEYPGQDIVPHCLSIAGIGGF